MKPISAVVLIASLLTLTPQAAGQTTGAYTYTVWGSVIFNRMGERTPEVLGDLPIRLTSLGAQQSYAQGEFFKNRYLSPSHAGGIPPIHGMSTSIIDEDELYVLALDEQTSVASAQAFLQGLYPPFTSNDSTSLSSNGDYIAAPLNGYQYSQIHTSGALDPEYVYLGGSINCPSFTNAASNYYSTAQFAATQSASKHVYEAIGPGLLSNVLIPEGWDYVNAYPIYDYINYQVAHNATVASLMKQSQYNDPSTNTSYLTTLRWLADQHQYGQLSNMSAYNNVSQRNDLPEETTGSISTIAGNFLAAKMLAHLEMNVETAGMLYKLSLLFGDFEPLLSLFALMNLPHTDSDFTGLPQFASSAVFEMYSWENSTNVTYPTTDNLFVAFHFRNGSSNNTDFHSYPAFNLGPSETDMPWLEFQELMYNIMLDNVGDWCTQCGAKNLFCAAWNSSLSLASTISGSSSSGSSSSSSSHSQLSPAAAGAVGAVVTLVIAALIFALLMLLAGLRFHRVPARHTSDLGGFKGSRKLASDRDLTLPKGGAVADETVVDYDHHSGGHERVGSWEMKDAEDAKSVTRPAPAMRQSFDPDDLRVNAYQEPVKPSERV